MNYLCAFQHKTWQWATCSLIVFFAPVVVNYFWYKYCTRALVHLVTSHVNGVPSSSMNHRVTFPPYPPNAIDSHVSPSSSSSKGRQSSAMIQFIARLSVAFESEHNRWCCCWVGSTTHGNHNVLVHGIAMIEIAGMACRHHQSHPNQQPCCSHHHPRLLFLGLNPWPDKKTIKRCIIIPTGVAHTLHSFWIAV